MRGDGASHASPANWTPEHSLQFKNFVRGAIAGLGFSAEVSFFPKPILALPCLATLAWRFNSRWPFDKGFWNWCLEPRIRPSRCCRSLRKRAHFWKKCIPGWWPNRLRCRGSNRFWVCIETRSWGTARLAQKQERYWIEFEDWSSVLASEVRAGGARFLVLTTPPWTRMQIEVEANGDLVLQAGQGWQEKYVFRLQTA